MIRVLLVDDQTLVRQGIRELLLLMPDLELAGEASDGIEALALLETLQVDVLLLDVRMPRLSGVDLLERLRTEGKPCPPAVLLTTFDDDEALLKGMRFGARGFLLKDVSVDRLADAIRAVAAGHTMIRPAVTERVERMVDSAPPQFEASILPDPLTRRELEVLRLMAGGFSNREIAESLDAGEGTVKNHISVILSKLGVRDRTRAVLKGIDLGLV
ncbi:MAG: response regulator transcription factor [Bryobacterales bacterium]|nr:response regulator transcription factor [Bryobacterales bacterium]